MKSVSRKFDWLRMPRLADLEEVLEALGEHIPARSCHRFIWVLIDSGLEFGFEYTSERIEKICKKAATRGESFFEKRCTEAQRKEIIEEILTDSAIFEEKEGVYRFIPAEFAEEDARKYAEKVDKFNEKRREQRNEERAAPVEKKEAEKEETKRIDYTNVQEACESIKKFCVLAASQRIPSAEAEKRAVRLVAKKEEDSALRRGIQDGCIQAAREFKKAGKKKEASWAIGIAIRGGKVIGQEGVQKAEAYRKQYGDPQEELVSRLKGLFEDDLSLGVGLAAHWGADLGFSETRICTEVYSAL